MKRIFIVVVSLFFLVSVAEAGQKDAKFKHADKNKDGAIDKKEIHMKKDWENKKKDKAKKIFKEADANKDGVVSEAEINNWKPSKKANSWWKKKADTNNDGVASEEEAAAWKKLCNEKMDLNGDGKIDKEEKEKCLRHCKAKGNTKIEKQCDVNKDGIIDSEETKTMKEDADK